MLSSTFTLQDLFTKINQQIDRLNQFQAQGLRSCYFEMKNSAFFSQTCFQVTQSTRRPHTQTQTLDTENTKTLM